MSVITLFLTILIIIANYVNGGYVL